MTENVSYTPEEVASILKISRFTVYELIKRGDLRAFHIGRKVRVEAADLEIYKQNAKGSPAAVSRYELREQINDSFIICGQDIVLDILTRQLERKISGTRFLRNQLGSIDGLLALYKGTADVVTAHLWDGDSGEYNLPYVRRLLPGQKTVAVNLVFRYEGFYVGKGNPKAVQTWEDLTRPEIRFINRECGSGARVLLDEQLRKLGIEPERINGYTQEELSHLAVASKVARGEADVGLGIEKAALQVAELEFITLQKERYDLIMRQQDMGKPQFKCLLEILRSSAFRAEVAGMGGYDVSSMGEIIEGESAY